MKHAILCVDDEVDNVEALERLFRKKYSVFKATSGDEALRVLKEQKISLIVTDQRMPGMTGVELLQKSLKIQPESIRILLTGYTDIESVISAVNSGQIYRYVTKPWDPAELSSAVDRAVERYELTSELKEKNLQLEAALSELKTLDQAKSNFMILINHELKTPLTVMLSFISLLNESTLDSDQKKYVARVSQSADRLHALINDTLELVSAETGTMPVKNSNLDLSKMAAEITGSFESVLSEKGMSIAIDCQRHQVKTDSKALRSILQRLLDNAIKFGTEKSIIDLKADLIGDSVRIQVTNSGKAVKAETIAKILKPFALDEDAMNHSKGTGLGLSVVQALLHRLGAQLEIESPKGKFQASFELPSA